MNIPELVTDLLNQGVKFQINKDKIKISSKKVILTHDVMTTLGLYKPEVLKFLREHSAAGSKTTEPVCSPTQNSPLETIGRLISGLPEADRSEEFRSPTVDAQAMAKSLSVTFRPVPPRASPLALQNFRQSLEEELNHVGVKVIPWQEATKEFDVDLSFAPLGFKKKFKKTIVKSEINAVVDIEKEPSIMTRIRVMIAEVFYVFYRYFVARGQQISVPRIAILTGWAEHHVALQLENPTQTQVIMLTTLNPQLADPQLPYPQKIKVGLNTLVRTFSEIVIGVSETHLSILNMNLSDSVFPRAKLGDFLLSSLIPKIFVPILPLSISRFECGQFNPKNSPYAQQLVELSQSLAPTHLFPSGSKLSQLIKRRSHRDLVDVIVNGRTGVSYGFLAYAEPPLYLGNPEITAAEWDTLQPVSGFSAEALRENEAHRWFIKTCLDGETNRFQQIPDIWIVSSRSGANKIHLNLDGDIVRMGLNKRLFFQIPEGVNPESMDIKPSYDLYVMMAIALAAALYTPKLIQAGAPIVHFHGYPAASWFQPHEYCAGINNPSVPCGTYESGVLNYLGLQRIAQQQPEDIRLVGLIEPDHGTNIIAPSLDYLLERLNKGCETTEIVLGGSHFDSLSQISF